MTEVESVQRVDQSIYMDFVLKDDVLTQINMAIPDEEASTTYQGWVEIYEGDKSIYKAEMDINEDGTAYELRLSSDLLKTKFKSGKKYVLCVYEYNPTNGYKMYLHKETIKITNC